MNIPRSFLPVCLLICLTALPGFAQDMEYARKVVDDLCTDEMAGRGYVEDGDNIAAYYIEQEFKGMGLLAWDFNYYQLFTMPVNTFPGKVEVAVDGTVLGAGKDFIVEADAPGIRGTYALNAIAELPAIAPSGRIADSTASYKGVVVLPDSLMTELPPSIRSAVLKGLKRAGATAVIRVSDQKLTWNVSKQQASLAQFIVKKEVWPMKAAEISLNVQADLIRKHRTQNVLAFIEGEYPDRFIVFTAHYDHLGKMGKDVIFRGANDNASGVSMLLNLAKHYSIPGHRPKYSIAFIAFAAEEPGLEGSFHYVRNPIFPLDNIEFLINLDLLGTGSEGVAVVNGAVHPSEFKRLVAINNRKKYLINIKKRGKAAISDHYPFSEAGVPAFYIYTMGGPKAYHDVSDNPETLPLTEFGDIFLLMTDFVETF